VSGVRAITVVVTLALVSLLGWELEFSDYSGSHGGGRVVHDEGEGILSASSGGGGQGLWRPAGLGRNQRWLGSFGGMLMCVRDKGSGPVRVESVRYEFVVPPKAIHTWVRTVPERAEQHPGEPIEWAPFYGLVGAPGAFQWATIRGAFKPFQGGLEISEACRKGPLSFTELVTVLETGPSGAWSRGVLIDYTADGKAYTLRVPWEMAVCGRATREYCYPSQ
jgi:hypothetical protein